ncbi:hypothetical protein EJG51_003845 [Undibacterium piscinae]|uniref:Uncharacterized protein n=1 Tax=Undibacterium piscinae TaxID=2495591 RepID=A0A6M3ZZS6_9BURK|nr:hypothetical protein EJG51_003845 [Undibacterium piscinae]
MTTDAHGNFIFSRLGTTNYICGSDKLRKTRKCEKSKQFFHIGKDSNIWLFGLMYHSILADRHQVYVKKYTRCLSMARNATKWHNFQRRHADTAPKHNIWQILKK